MYVVGFAKQIFLDIVYLPRCIVICFHLGLVYVRCRFCPANHSGICVFAPVHCHQCSFCHGALSSVFNWDSCMYGVGFSPLIILAIVLLLYYSLCSFGTHVCTLLVLPH
jgi:hypothetical protein